MKVIIEAPFDLSDKDRKTIEDKIKGLEKYDDRMTEVTTFFKMDDGKTPGDVLAEIRVRVPGSDLFAAESESDSMKAFGSVYQNIKRQIKKRRDKLNDHQSDVRGLNEIVNNSF